MALQTAVTFVDNRHLMHQPITTAFSWHAQSWYCYSKQINVHNNANLNVPFHHRVLEPTEHVYNKATSQPAATQYAPTVHTSPTVHQQYSTNVHTSQHCGLTGYIITNVWICYLPFETLCIWRKWSTSYGKWSRVSRLGVPGVSRTALPYSAAHLELSNKASHLPKRRRVNSDATSLVFI